MSLAREFGMEIVDEHTEGEEQSQRQLEARSVT